MIRERFPGIKFVKGWRNEIFDSLSLEPRIILVRDDEMGVASSSTSMAELFTKGSKHRNLTVFYLLQKEYNKGKSQRTISLNSHNSKIFCNGRNALQFCTMPYQIFPNDGNWLVYSFTDATSKPSGYLLLDHHPSSYETRRSSPIFYLKTRLPII